MRKIIIAGAGHGGLTVASRLAKKGYDVSLYEKLKKENLGYDWDDTIEYQTFNYAGIDNFDPKDLKSVDKSSFYSTSLNTCIEFEFPEQSKIYGIQRKALYKYLLDNAENAGVKLHFERNVEKVITDNIGRKVCGIYVDNEEILADLVIDSAGMNSPLRDSLPDNYMIDKKFGNDEVFHTYRALYNIKDNQDIIGADSFNVYFKFNSLQGIAWFKVVNGLADILIGNANPMTREQAKIHLDELMKYQPCIGDQIIKGGTMNTIPIRPCFSRIVGDNYAAIGDVVSMTIPINGSGITNSIHAGKMLADVITDVDLGTNDRADYSIENLWDYQVKYMRTIGAKMISIDMIKKCLLNFQPIVLDYMFDRGVIDYNDIRAGVLGEEINMTLGGIITKVRKGYKKIPSLMKLNNSIRSSKKAKEHTLNIPVVFNEEAVKLWCQRYDSFIK